jgi:hypothetical protein
MDTSKTSPEFKPVSRTPNAHFSISRTRVETHRPLLRDRQDPPPNLYCSGRCTEATAFEHLCGSCLTEWHDWEKERA